MINPAYLGDAVYVSFDGYHIWLHLNSHDSPGVVALEPQVMSALKDYEARITALRAASATGAKEDQS